MSHSKGGYENLQKLLQTICIRRTRDLLHLPEPSIQTIRLHFTGEEHSDYQNLLQQCKKRFDMAVSGHVKGKISISTVLEALLELRLFCNNGRKHSRSVSAGLPVDKDEALSYLQQHEQNICSYCSGTIFSISDSEDADGGVFTSPSCSHLVCRSCLPGHRAQPGPCKFCEAGDQAITFRPIVSTTQQHQPAPVNSISRPLSEYPSKLQACLSDIKINSSHKRYVCLP